MVSSCSGLKSEEIALMGLGFTLVHKILSYETTLRRA